jgi:Pyruvate/2-oxoacid:ferredoxin oxidoreductase delta subunit
MSCLSIFSPNDEGNGKPTRRKNKQRLPQLPLETVPLENTVFSHRKGYFNPVKKALGALACTPCGKSFAMCYENTIQIIEADTLSITYDYTFENDQVRCLTFATSGTLWIGTFGGVIYELKNAVLDEILRNDYTILAIAIDKDMSTFCYSNMDMKIFFHDLKTRNLINKMQGKAVSVDSVSYDHLGRLLTTSMEHIVHIWDKQGKLIKALIPIKEASFGTGRSYILNECNGTLLADKKEDRKKYGETYVWDLVTEKLLFTFKSLESSALVVKYRKILFDNQQQLCVYDMGTQIIDRNRFHSEDITAIAGCNDYCLSGSIDGYFSINYYRNIGDQVNDLLMTEELIDISWKFK